MSQRKNDTPGYYMPYDSGDDLHTDTEDESGSGSESFMNYAKYDNSRFTEAALFAGIIGLGLAGYCFWKACK
jgi:hypothetical protein